MNGGGTRDTGRVLGISPNTVTAVLKKRKNLQDKSMKNTWKTGKKIRLLMLKFVPSRQKRTKCGVIITISLTKYGYGGRLIMRRMCRWLIRSAQGSINIWTSFLACLNRFRLERFTLTIITHIRRNFRPTSWFQEKRIRKRLKEIIWLWEHVSKGFAVKLFAFLKVRTFILLLLVPLLTSSFLADILMPQPCCDTTQKS